MSSNPNHDPVKEMLKAETGSFTPKEREWERACPSCGKKIMVTTSNYESEVLCEDCDNTPQNLLELATQIHGLFDQISDLMETFISLGGRVNLTVHHNEGSEGIELHDLNGEFEARFFQVKELNMDPDVNGGTHE